MAKATRTQVYEAIDSERDYQDRMEGNAKGGDAPENPEAGMGLHKGVVLMQAYMDKLVAACALPFPQCRDESLNILRKVVALGVKTMEQNGAPRRALS